MDVFDREHLCKTMGKKILVLGGGGFIGGHLSKMLKKKGHHVRICDIKSHEFFLIHTFAMSLSMEISQIQTLLKK